MAVTLRPLPASASAVPCEKTVAGGDPVSEDRLSALDTSFLHMEDATAHMHVASVMVFDGDPPAYDDLIESIERRLHLVPRYPQRLPRVPLGPRRAPRSH